MSEIEDIWESVPTDAEMDSMVAASAEEAAIHVATPTERGRAFDDPARQDVATSVEDWLDLTVADDEDDGLVHRAAEHELDVEELLERQHYAFAPSTERDASW
jgi:hypothetical protein